MGDQRLLRHTKPKVMFPQNKPAGSCKVHRQGPLEGPTSPWWGFWNETIPAIEHSAKPFSERQPDLLLDFMKENWELNRLDAASKAMTDYALSQMFLTSWTHFPVAVVEPPCLLSDAPAAPDFTQFEIPGLYEPGTCYTPDGPLESDFIACGCDFDHTFLY